MDNTEARRTKETAGARVQTVGMTEKRRRLLTICYMAVMTALSVGLIALLHFPIFPAVAFLEYDPGDIPIMISGYMLGWGPGMIITAVVCLFQAFLLGGNGVYGLIMHVLATGTFVTVGTLVYHAKKTRTGAAISLVCASLSWVAVMFVANIFITPFFMGVPRDVVWSLMPFILAFNAIKAFGNSLIVFFIYKPLRRLLNRHDLIAR